MQFNALLKISNFCRNLNFATCSKFCFVCKGNRKTEPWRASLKKNSRANFGRIKITKFLVDFQRRNRTINGEKKIWLQKVSRKLCNSKLTKFTLKILRRGAFQKEFCKKRKPTRFSKAFTFCAINILEKWGLNSQICLDRAMF